MLKGILLVDDSQYLQACLADTLDMEGCEMIITSNGTHALSTNVRRQNANVNEHAPEAFLNMAFEG